MLEQCSIRVKMAAMPKPTPRAERRTDALSKERIVEAAIEILDTEGESALTFRALAARLATGSGAIYWHVAGKDELLATAAGDIVARVMAGVVRRKDARKAIREVALGLFDAIDAHPWVGTQLARAPWETALVQIFEGIGGQLAALGVAPPARFDAACALVNYILGIAGQNAANARMHAPTTDRAAFLGDVARRWTQLDPAHFPFVHQVAAQLPVHDDRAQFVAGIDWMLDGMAPASRVTRPRAGR